MNAEIFKNSDFLRTAHKPVREYFAELKTLGKLDLYAEGQPLIWRVEIGLIIHIALDLIDCVWMRWQG